MDWDTVVAWLGEPVGGLLTGLFLVVCAVVYTIFGITMLLAAYDKRKLLPPPRWWRPEWWPESLELYLGLLFICLDGLTFGYLGFIIVNHDSAVPRWYAIVSTVCFILVVKAASHFAKDRRR